MSTALNNVTLERLQQFRRRRHRLVKSRGWSAVITAFIATLLLAVAVDALFTDNSVRWASSSLIYATTLTVWYLLCWRPFRNRESWEAEAMRIEQIEPRLREQLLPAVELANDRNAQFDSPEFRGHLQHQVAQSVAQLNTAKLLPWKLIKRWLLAACGAVALIIVLGLIPQLHFLNRIARALMPAANLDRIASVAIAIEQPQPHSKVVPQGDIVGVLARIDGPRPEEVLLEQRSIDGSISVVAMQSVASAGGVGVDSKELPSSESPRFSGAIPTDATAIDYRVRAAGASTAWHRLTTQPRPEVLEFEKTLTPLEYSGLKPLVITSDEGNIRTLVGTQVRLSLKIDQPVTVAELRWQSVAEESIADEEQSGETQSGETQSGETQSGEASPAGSVPLERDAATGRYIATFTVEKSDKFRIYLKATETGFTNEFSPTYTVEAITDQPPSIAWTLPKLTSQIVAPEQILSMAAQVYDELPYSKLTQLARINRDGEWRPLDIAATPPQLSEGETERFFAGVPTSHAVEWKRDLLTLSLKAGDIVETKLVAVDRKGQEAESEIVELLVSASTITLEPSPTELARQNVAEELEAFQQVIRPLQEKIRDLAKSGDKKDGKPLDPNEPELTESQKREALVAASEELAATVEKEVPDLLQAIEKAAGDLDNNLAQMELEQIGAALINLQHKTNAELQDTIANNREPVEEANPAKATEQNKKQLEQIAQRAQQVEHASRLLAERSRTEVSHDVQKRLAEQTAKLEQLFDDFAKTSQDSDVNQNKRELSVLARQAKELQQSLVDAIPEVRPDAKQRLRQTADSIDSFATRIENASESDKADEHRNATEQFAKSLSQMKNGSWFDGGLNDAIVDSHRRIDEIAGQPAELLRKTATAMTESNKNAGSQKADAQTAVERLEAQAEAAVTNLTDRRSLLRAAKDSDRQFASDLGNAARAARQVLADDSLAAPDKQRELNETATALETLQAAHAVEEASALLEDALRGERWSLNTTAARIDRPLVFNSFAERAERASKLLRQAKASNEIADAVDRLRWNESAAKASQKINARRWEQTPPVSAAAELSQLSEELAAVQSKLQPLVKEARAQLAEQGPALSELAEKAAEATEELQQQTEALADDVQRDEVPDQGSRMAQLQAEQQKVNQPVAELRDALVDHANAQNLLDKQELRAARDADLAIGIVDNVQEKLDQSMENAAAAPVAKEPRAEALGAAANEQATAAQTLQKLAENLKQAEQMAAEGNESSNLSEQLAELAGELGTAAEMPPGYNEAEQLARLAAAQPEEVLRQLEKKLATSKPMQQEMSRISREAAEQALNRLERAADQQEKMQPQLESSDPVVQAEKKLMLQDLQTTRENANQLLGLLVSESKWTAGAAKEEAVQKRIDATEAALRSALQATERASMERTAEELRATASQLADSLKQTQEALNSASEDLQKAKDTQVHQSDADLANRKREMVDRQRRIAQQDVRNLQNTERQQQQLLRQAENELKQSDQREKALQKQVENNQNQLNKKPEDEYLKRQLADAERNLALGKSQKRVAEVAKQQQEKRVEKASKAREEANAQKPTELNTPNPSAQLSSDLAKQAADRSAKLAEQLQPWTDADKAPKLQAAGSQLQNSQRDENSVQQSVNDSADDLARAARHESRMNNAQASQQLATQSQQAEQLSQEQIEAAEQKLASAQENSQRADSPTGQADAASSAQAMSSMQQAEAAIREQAGALRAMLAADAQAANNAANQQAASQPSQPQSQQQGQQQGQQQSQSGAQAATDSNSLLNSQQMAQLLDELDRQLNQGTNQQQQAAQNQSQPGDAPTSDAGQQSAANQPASNQPTPSTLAAAAQKISSQMSRNREAQQSSQSQQSQPGESSKANMEPQGPVAVKVVDISRIGDDWGKLRERAAEDMLESKRESLSPAYRQQIDAYFRALSERAQGPAK